MNNSNFIDQSKSVVQFERATTWLLSDPLFNISDITSITPRVIPQTLAAYKRFFGEPQVLTSPFGDINFWNLFSMKIYLMDFGEYRVVHIEPLDVTECEQATGTMLARLNNENNLTIFNRAQS